jgi:nickel-dependent lactate racemase
LTLTKAATYHERMQVTLKYGAESTVPLEIPPEHFRGEYGQPVGEPLDDVTAAMAAALVEPIHFPPLSEATVPGDRVAIPLDPGLPQAPALVAGLVQSLCEVGITASDITVLWTAEASAEIDPRSGLAADLAEQVQFLVHDPTDRNAMGYLTVSAENQPIYLNRALQDADVVLPIGCLRVETTAGYHGIHSVVFPTYSDRETLDRYHAPSNEDSDVPRRRRGKETVEAACLLGVITTIQVIPGSGDSILHILAGDPTRVLAEGQLRCDAVWHYEVPQRAQLVIAGIEGNARSQTWENLAHAVTSALHVVEEGGVIAICSELATAPGEALQQLAAADDYETTWHEMRRQRSADAVSASQLLKAMQQARIFLLSQLEEEEVAELGIAPVADAHEIIRLASRFESCIILANAQYAKTTATAEADRVRGPIEKD